MSMYRAMQCRLDEDLSQLVIFLRQQGVPHRITEERGEQVIWTRDGTDADSKHKPAAGLNPPPGDDLLRSRS